MEEKKSCLECGSRVCRTDDYEALAPEFCPGKTLSAEMIQTVWDRYHEEENNRVAVISAQVENEYSNALITTLVTKDRVLAHNPVGALYQIGSYYVERSRHLIRQSEF